MRVIDIERHLDRIEYRSNRDAETHVVRGSRFTLFNMLIRPPLRFIDSYILRMRLLDGSRGFVYSLLDAYASFLTYAKAWELSAQKKPK